MFRKPPRKHESTFELAGAEMTITSSTLSDVDAQQLLPTGNVTLLLADIEGSTRLWETQPDRMAAALATMDRALAELPPRVRATFLLHRRDGMTLEEIGRQFGVSRAQAKKYLAKALVQFRKVLEE